MALLSDFEGSATMIAIATPGKGVLRNPHATLAKALGDLPSLLHPRCKIIWVNGSLGDPIAPFEIDGRVVIPVQIQTGDKMPGRMVWMQDPFVCQHHAGVTTLVLPSHANGREQAMVQQISLYLGWEAQAVNLHLEGGNMLQIGDALLLGKDLAYQNGIAQLKTWLHPNRAAWETLESKFCAVFGTKRVVWVGTRHQVVLPVGCEAIVKTTWQPLFHLDLFLLNAGVNHRGNPRIFLGELFNIDHLELSDDDHAALAVLRDALDEIGLQLLGDFPGLEIARLPILTVLQANRLSVQSLCNGWTEVTAGEKQAFLPDFRKSTLYPTYQDQVDQAHLLAEASLENWGFCTRWVDMNFSQLAREGGALHCAVKILERTI
jgi:hypothetical protein